MSAAHQSLRLRLLSGAVSLVRLHITGSCVVPDPPRHVYMCARLLNSDSFCVPSGMGVHVMPSITKQIRACTGNHVLGPTVAQEGM
jgi:hypothetical protein